MKKKYPPHKKRKQSLVQAKSLLNSNLSFKDFSEYRQNAETSLKNAFSRSENENNKDKMVIFY